MAPSCSWRNILSNITCGMGSKTCQNMILILKYSLLQTFKMPQIVTLSCANKIKIRASGKLSCLNFDLLLPFRQKMAFFAYNMGHIFQVKLIVSWPTTKFKRNGMAFTVAIFLKWQSWTIIDYHGLLVKLLLWLKSTALRPKPPAICGGEVFRVFFCTSAYMN